MTRGLAAFAGLLALTGGAGGGRPNLVESAVSISQHRASVRVTDVVRNVGAARAGSSTTVYYLGRARIGRRAVPALRPGGRSRGSVALTIPATVPSGVYPLRACSDGRGRVRESDERDNCRLSAKAVHVSDRTPPKFAGLQRATTCIPGPVGGETRSSRYSLQWATATDETTPSTGIVYDIYQASAVGSENFASPTYTTAPGDTTFSTPPLPDDKAYYFVVRARDEAGNRDTNTVERPGVNLCL